MFAETQIDVSERPHVALLVAQSPGPGDSALLVIHGGPDWDHTYLRDPLSQLAGRYRLVMPDIRGCGRSTCGLPADQYTPDAVVADLVALLDLLGLGQVDLLGFSYGGLLAQRLTLAEPDRIRRLIVASSSVYPVPPGAFSGWRDRDVRVTAEAAVWANPRLSGPELVRAAAVARARADVWRDDRVPGYLGRLSDVHFTAEWLGPFRAGILPSARPVNAARRLAELGLPVLLLHGAQDMTFPAGLAVRAAAAIPAATAVVLEDAGHMAHVDRPGPWLDALAGFLDRPLGRTA
jgi:pimeloyl-ACP methyl ester carboxylesterase